MIKNEKLRDVGRNGTIEVQLTLLSDKEKILLLKSFYFQLISSGLRENIPYKKKKFIAIFKLAKLFMT